MPLSHKEGFAARSSKITPCFGASASMSTRTVRCLKLLNNVRRAHYTNRILGSVEL